MNWFIISCGTQNLLVFKKSEYVNVKGRSHRSYNGYGCYETEDYESKNINMSVLC